MAPMWNGPSSGGPWGTETRSSGLSSLVGRWAAGLGQSPAHDLLLPLCGGATTPRAPCSGPKGRGRERHRDRGAAPSARRVEAPGEATRLSTGRSGVPGRGQPGPIARAVARVPGPAGDPCCGGTASSWPGSGPGRIVLLAGPPWTPRSGTSSCGWPGRTPGGATSASEGSSSSSGSGSRRPRWPPCSGAMASDRPHGLGPLGGSSSASRRAASSPATCSPWRRSGSGPFTCCSSSSWAPGGYTWPGRAPIRTRHG